ncbi:RND transporter [Sulfuriferula plumbiphila]|uniref:RND transporter n=1 Tax=Sulfuriferula plumbiphila TaxID=171865 RepID=A0A512LB79_9PROT|nr:efflux transporter outer membrane subunit [Sulfuriferula plumbiphila]BBP04442.1 RND transporter [Sulfuriferula plumbiphila]GEP31744.1 RND transporter [Sulfuriferula plumbiphila]
MSLAYFSCRVVPGMGMALGLVLVLSGCADFSGIRTQAQMIQLQSLAATGRQANPGTFPQQRWWIAFGDAGLDALIAQAMAANPSLKIAQSRVIEAQASAAATGSPRYPQLNGEAKITRERLSENSIYPPPLGGSTVTMNSANLAGQWQLDLFGKNRAALDAAIGQSRAAEADAQAARMLLAANVAQRYFSLARLLAQQDLDRALLRQREQILELVRQRVAAGLDTTLAQRQAQAEVPQIRRDLAVLDEQAMLARHALAALIGAGPSATDKLLAHLPSVGIPQVPRQIPAELLGHRADVVAARWRVESELQGIREARAAFYPNINLSAFIGFESIGLSKWLSVGSRTFGVGPALSLPIFDAGLLRARLQGHTARADAAIESYNAAVLNAIRDVADQLSSWHALQAQLQEQMAAQAAVSSAYDLALARYQGGLSNYLNVLTAENAVLQQRRILIDLQARVYDLDVGLARALGGGYVAAGKAAPQLSNGSQTKTVSGEPG